MNTLPTTRPPSPPDAAQKPVSTIRFVLAMLIALGADSLGAWLGEFGIVVFDLFVGLLLAICLRGFRPEIIIACLIEAIPGIGLFPSWSLAVPALWARLRLGAPTSAGTGRESTRPR